MNNRQYVHMAAFLAFFAYVALSMANANTVAIVPPTASNINVGQPITLTAVESGFINPSYQWSVNSLYQCPGFSDSGTDSLKYTPTSNTAGCAIDLTATETATVSVSGTSNADAGQTITLTPTVRHAGATTLSYQWYNATNTPVPITGATSATYSATAGTTNGVYSYYVVVTASNGGVIESNQISVTVYPALIAGSFTPTNITIDKGQSVTLAVNASGGTGSYSYKWYSGDSATCSSDTDLVGTASTLKVTPASDAYYCYKVTDTGTTSANTNASSAALVTVYPALIAAQFTPKSPIIDNGQTVTLTANVFGGTGSYTYQWYSGSKSVCSSNSPIPGANSVSYTVSPSSTTYYCYTVNDTGTNPTYTNDSHVYAVTVYSALSAGAFTPASPVIDVGQSVTLTAKPSGGSGSYSYQWYSGTSATCSSDTNVLGTASTQVVSPTSNTYYCYTVNDTKTTLTDTSVSPTGAVTVYPALMAGSFTPASLITDNGQSVTLTANASGGTGSYSYKWYYGGSSVCSSDANVLGAASTQVISPASNTYYCYKVTDTETTSANINASSAALVTVYPALIAAPFTPTSPILDNGQTITLTAEVSGGTGSYTYQWYSGSNAKCSNNSPIPGANSVSYTVSPSSTTYYCYTVNDTGTSPAYTNDSHVDKVTVHPALSAGAFIPASPVIDNGQSVTLTAKPSGGTGSGSYAYQWYYGGSATCANDTNALGTASTQTVSPTSNTYYCYTVNDTGTTLPDASASPADIVTVYPAISAGAFTPASPVIDDGQSVTLAVNVSGGTGSYSYKWYSGDSATCSLDTDGLGTASTQKVTPASNTYYCYDVTDKGTTSQDTNASVADNVTVYPSVSVPTLDNSTSSSITVGWTGGTSPYNVTLLSGTRYKGSCKTSGYGIVASVVVEGNSTTFTGTNNTSYYCAEVEDSSQGTPASKVYSGKAVKGT